MNLAGKVRRALKGNNNQPHPTPAPTPPIRDYDEISLDSLNVARLLFFDHLCRITLGVQGDIVECGVASGNSLLMLAHIVHIRGIPKALWGFDSFEGFPEPSPEDASVRSVKKGELRYDKQRVLRTLRNHLNDELFFRSKISIIKGFFEDTLHLYKGPISILNLDCDLYKSYKFCLETLYSQVSSGGVITFDEYHREGDIFPGAPRAIDEFFADKDVSFLKDPLYGKFYVVKP